MMEMIRLLDDMVERVGGFVNFIFCFILASIMASVIMMLFASVCMFWIKVR